MKIGTRFDFVEGEFDTDTDELVCVGNKKYGQVSLCFVTKNLNVGFAKIKLFSRDRAVDADATYEDAMALGEEIARRWNAKPAPATADKWQDEPTTTGYYFVENRLQRLVVHWEADDGDVAHRGGICKLRAFTGWKWWGPIKQPAPEAAEGGKG